MASKVSKPPMNMKANRTVPNWNICPDNRDSAVLLFFSVSQSSLSGRLIHSADDEAR